MTEKSSKEVVDEMISGLRKSKNVYDIFADQVKTKILIQGKTMEQWTKYFKVTIPDTATMDECKELDIKLMDLHEEATFFKAMAEGVLTLNKNAQTSTYRSKFTALVAEYKKEGKKLPAKDTLETLAKIQMEEVEGSLTYAEMAVKFWKEILEDLHYKRRLIENITINNTSAAKMVPNHSY